MEYKKPDRINWLFAGLTTLTAFIVYFKTMAVSVSLWDCGEFIACARIFGIAHPPGTPLFVIFGRVFSMIPFLGEDIAHRITFVSVLSSAASAGFAYLIVSKVISWWIENKSTFINRLPMYIGGIIGALLMAFSRTWWTNAVEAEVYGLTLLAAVVTIFLALVWYERRDEPKSDRLVFLMVFISMLGVGAHMAAFLLFPAVVIFLFLCSPRLLREPRVWISIFTAMIMIVDFNFFLIALLLWLLISIANALADKDFDWVWAGVFFIFFVIDMIIYNQAPSAFPWVTGVGLALFLIRSFSRISPDKTAWLSVFTLFVLVEMVVMGINIDLFFWSTLLITPVFIVKAFSTRSYWWRWALSFTVMAALGFSVQLTTLVRAQHRPRINMTNPDTLQRLSDYLARKQYGQGNMITRMFDRRGELSHQFGDYPRMGMLGFWKDQYSPNIVPFAIWLFIGMWGIYYAIRMRWKVGVLILIIAVAGTIGITMYMNFADGSIAHLDPNAKLEVRDRDYFWTHGFGMFGWAIGLGIAGFIHLALGFLQSRKNLNKLVIPAAVLFALTVFIPAFAVAKNYNYNNRSGEWLPYQFAHDMLTLCEPNAVLFTGGDNDTYPLWALQEAYEFRRDVKIINLSLANVDWYVLHCKEVFGAPMTVDREQIEVKEFETVNGIEKRPDKRYHDKFRNVLTYFVTQPIRNEQGQMIDIREMAQLVIESVIDASMEQRGDTMILNTPIYFTSRTDPVMGVRYTDLIRNMERVANLFKIKDTVVAGETPQTTIRNPYLYNVDRTYDLFMNEFIFDGMKDPGFARGEFTTMMVYRYYANEIDIIIDSMLARNDTAKVLPLIDKGREMVPEYYKVPRWRAVADSLQGAETDSLLKYQQAYVEYMAHLLDKHPENDYYIKFISDALYNIYRQTGEKDHIDEALEYLNSRYGHSAQDEWLFEGVLEGYVLLEDYERLRNLIRQYAERNINSEFRRPVFLLAIDYMDENRLEEMEIVLRAYFSGIGMDTRSFRDLVQLTLSEFNLDALQVVQSVYFEIYPNDVEAQKFMQQLMSRPTQ